MQKNHSIKALCDAFQVSKSGYYQWLNRELNPSLRQKENQSLVDDIKRIHGDSRKTYGAPRITIELRKEGKHHGKNRVANLMRKQNICGRSKMRFRLKTTDSNHDQPIFPNRAKDLIVDGPNQLWAADLTYVAVADLIPGLHARPELRDTASQALLIALGIGTIALVGSLLAH